MPYEVYKIIHLSSLILFFCSMAITLVGEKDIKLFKILAGVTSLLILISGMGLLARVGVQHGSMPSWALYKLGIWLVMAVGFPVVAKRLEAQKKNAFWFFYLLFIIGSIVINYRV